ncbi:hypothetical protein AtubIFM55763_003041 [Aspergillus tubingensis]|nr:hypothetical protein AtubIFM55763_003041 [Aspergillus tubingensis]
MSPVSQSQIPTSTSGWTLVGTAPDDGSGALVWNDELRLPELGPTDVLEAISPSFHDTTLILTYVVTAVANGTFPWSPADHGTGSLIPGSDGAGEVIAIGSHVTRFKPTDRVIVVYYPNFTFGAAPTNLSYIVIATTSSDEKARRLKEMGVQHVLSYKQDPNWGETATKLTRGELGCRPVIEAGGAQTIKQSFECVARGGEIDIIGFLTGQGHAEDGPT